MEPKHWLFIGLGLLGVGGLLFGMSSVNVNSAIAKCQGAGYAAPERALTVTACPADEDYAYDSIALVVGNVASSPEPTLTDEASTYIRNSLAKQNGELKISAYSATPSGVQINSADKKIKRAGNVTAFIRNSSKKIEDIDKSIKQQPYENGVDYFNTIMTAARSVQTSKSIESPLVLVVGSGISDTQPLNFADNDLLHADPVEILNALKASQNITPGELSGLTIVWSGLGISSLPQQPLDAKEKANLQRVYRMIFEYMGAQFNADNTVMATDSIDTDFTVRPAKVNGLAGGVALYKLGENSVGFTSGTAKIIDQAKANNALAGIVSNYQTCPNAKITIEGYQALLSGEKVEETSPLSQQRADAIKNLLSSQGVPSAQITANGRGSSAFDGRVSEIDAEGKWDDERAQSNRVVLVKMQSSGACN